jgi:predicted enzyme related to lactoylglutathione lyase
MSYLPGKFVWFEHVSKDPAKAKAFYSALFGWSVNAMPMGEQAYDMIMLGDAGIGGFRKPEADMPSHWGSYLSVDDVDKSFAKATAAGAKALMPPMNMGEVGRAAAVADPTGAAFALWKGGQGDPADVEKTPAGGWMWNELHSSDAKGAVAFYEKAFGFSHDAMDMGPGGTYYVLKDAAGNRRAGVMQKSADMPMPSNWLPYVSVADCDAAAAKATKLGALSLAMPPTDIPNIGRFAVLIDPVGAAIAIMKPVEMMKMG